jgi:serine/threonine protein kinase
MNIQPGKDELSPEEAEQLFGVYEEYWQNLCQGSTGDERKPVDTHAEADLKVLAALHAVRQAVVEDSVVPTTCDWPPHPSSLAPRLSPGTRLGDYLVKSLLGRGGMGEVYLAEHELMGRQVAIKVLPAIRDNSAGGLRRFHTEIKALARLGTHPNLAAAFHAGDHEGCIFLVLEYIPGTDLNNLVLRQGPLEPLPACAFIRQAALGLAHAHEHGIVHRDIKPANLMLTPDGTIKVLDLGLAQAREANGVEEGQTQPGVLLGTPDYLAPEQAENPRLADARSDLYSLGCTWYFLLTGRAPFAGHSALSKLRAHALEAPPPLHQLRPEVPEAMVAIVDRLLCKRPEERIASARDFIAALDALPRQEDSQCAGDPARNLIPLAPGPARRRFLPAIAAVLALLVGGSLIAMLILKREQPPETPPGNAKDLQVSWHIEHYRPVAKNDDLLPLGAIGQPGSAPRQHDRVAVVAQFSEPSYPCLLAINPDGSLQLLHPEPGQNPQELKPVRDFRAPQEGSRYYTLDDARFQGLVLLASRQPLPDFDQWRPSLDPEAWKKIQTAVAWSFDGRDLGPIGTQRVGITEHGPKVLADLCRDLQSRTESVIVRAVAFPVRSK